MSCFSALVSVRHLMDQQKDARERSTRPLVTQQFSRSSHAVSEHVVPECVSQVAAAALGWPECTVQGDVGLADGGPVQWAVLCVRVVAVERTLRTENKEWIQFLRYYNGNIKLTIINVYTHREQRTSGGAGLVLYTLFSSEDILNVLPHLFVEYQMEEEDEDSLGRRQSSVSRSIKLI